MTKTKYSLPWIDSLIKCLIRKRDKLYFRARKSSSPDINTNGSEHMFKRSLETCAHIVKRLIRKRDKLYFRARKSSSPDIYTNGSEHMFKRSFETCAHIGSIFPISSLLRQKTLIRTAPGKER